ncbi:MAG: hypothetical protein KDC26_05140 [Armatimonadetes bacterium]|nr:hypothetical protein [Armatimonadota bacterium]
MICLALTGCFSGGNKGGKADGASSAVKGVGSKMAEEAAGRRVVNSGEVTITMKRDDGSVAFEINAESSRVGIEDGSQEAFLNGVTGSLFDEGKEVSQFEAEEGKADSENKRLVLTKAKVKSMERDLALNADTIRWMEDRKLFAAEGSVTIQGANWSFGPSDVLWASPDLSELGSPEKFQKK